MTTERATIRCPMCDAETALERKRGDHPQCPDLVRLPPGWWLGYVADVDAQGRGIIQVVAFCSETCAERLDSVSGTLLPTTG